MLASRKVSCRGSLELPHDILDADVREHVLIFTSVVMLVYFRPVDSGTPPELYDNAVVLLGSVHTDHHLPLHRGPRREVYAEKQELDVLNHPSNTFQSYIVVLLQRKPHFAANELELGAFTYSASSLCVDFEQ